MPGSFYSSCFSHQSGAHSGHLSIENASLASVETYTLVHYLNWFTPHLITTVLASERALSNNLFHCFEFQLTEATIILIVWHFSLFQNNILKCQLITFGLKLTEVKNFHGPELRSIDHCKLITLIVKIHSEMFFMFTY